MSAVYVSEVPLAVLPREGEVPNRTTGASLAEFVTHITLQWQQLIAAHNNDTIRLSAIVAAPMLQDQRQQRTKDAGNEGVTEQGLYGTGSALGRWCS
jgi:hypothetical protein